MTAPIITTPRGSVIINQANMKAELKWDASFQPRFQRQFSAAQSYVDSEVLRLTEPVTPLITSMLIKSGILGTEIGSGVVSWIAPYARRVYYSPRAPGRETGPLRGGFWFERWKAVGARKVIAGARKIAGGG